MIPCTIQKVVHMCESWNISLFVTEIIHSTDIQVFLCLVRFIISFVSAYHLRNYFSGSYGASWTSTRLLVHVVVLGNSWHILEHIDYRWMHRTPHHWGKQPLRPLCLDIYLGGWSNLALERNTCPTTSAKFPISCWRRDSRPFIIAYNLVRITVVVDGWAKSSICISRSWIEDDMLHKIAKEVLALLYITRKSISTSKIMAFSPSYYDPNLWPHLVQYFS